jgi:hypothetical protein
MPDDLTARRADQIMRGKNEVFAAALAHPNVTYLNQPSRLDA